MNESLKKTLVLQSTYGATRTLILLLEGSSYPTRMARLIDVDRRAMLNTVQVLLELKLVECRKLSGQKRIKEIYDLTPLGRKTAQVLVESKRQIQDLFS